MTTKVTEEHKLMWDIATEADVRKKSTKKSSEWINPVGKRQ